MAGQSEPSPVKGSFVGDVLSGCEVGGGFGWAAHWLAGAQMPEPSWAAAVGDAADQGQRMRMHASEQLPATSSLAAARVFGLGGGAGQLVISVDWKSIEPERKRHGRAGQVTVVTVGAAVTNSHE